MRRHLGISLAGLLALAPLPALSDELAPAPLPHAGQFELRSQHNGQRYRLYVSEPQAAAPSAGYPVVYVLDGNALFPSLAMQARLLEIRPEVSGVSPVLVVGIGYPIDGLFDLGSRALDYTPPATGAVDHAGRPPRPSGGAAAFLDFIETELKPAIEARYPVDRRRQTLFGHSYGGLFVLYTLFNRPAAFDTYVAASPSIWWNRRQILDELDKLPRQGTIPARLLLTMGSLEQPPADSAPASSGGHQRADMRMLDNVHELAERLAPLASRGLYSELRIHPGEHHGSNPLLTGLAVIPFALSGVPPVGGEQQ